MATRWVITASGERAPLVDGRGEVTFTVTNPSRSPDHAMFTVIPGTGASSSWFHVDEPQRTVGGGSSTTYVVGIDVPAGTAPGRYDLQGRVYSAQSAPEETAVLSTRVVCEVPVPPVAVEVPPQRPWWLWLLLALAVIVLVGVLVAVLPGDGDGGGPLRKPVLLSPEEGDVLDEDEVRLEWSDANADRYVVTLVEACAEEQCETTEVPADGTTVRVDSRLLRSATTYSWSVTAFPADDDEDAPSPRTSGSRTFEVR